MKVKFDSLNRFEPPQMYVCNPGSVYRDGRLTNVIGCLYNTSDEELVLNFNATSELNLRVYYIRRNDPDEEAYNAKLYRSLQNRRMIFCEGIGFFIITSVSEDVENGLNVKDIKASSCEIEIENKMLLYIADGTYQFTELMDAIITSLPLWRIEYASDTVAKRYRTFQGISDDTNTLAFMMQNMQEAYECIFVFDTIGRSISVYDQHDYLLQTNIHLAKDDVLKALTISENADDLYTAIRVTGNDDLVISPINPVGTNIIYNFDHYLDWMTPSLRERVIAWKELIASYANEYYTHNLERFNMMEQQAEVYAEVDKLEIQLKMYRRCRENIIAENGTSSVSSYNDIIEANDGQTITIADQIEDTLSTIDELIASVQTELDTANEELSAIQTELSAVEGIIEDIRTQVAIETYFSETEYSELYHYIYEGSYHDEYTTITEQMTYTEKFQQMKQLYDRAMQQLDRASTPTKEFSLDVESFIFVQEFEPWSAQLTTGCLINVELSQDDIAELFLLNMTLNYDDRALNFTFGNRYHKYDTKSLFDDVLGNITKSANTLEYVKDILQPLQNGELETLRKALDESRTLTKDAVLSSTSESVVIDDTGYTGRRILESGLYDARQVKIVANSLVFTDDSWNSCKVALGELRIDDNTVAYGLNAECIMGNMILGNQLHILDENGEDIFAVFNNQITASVSDKLSKTGGNEDDTFGWALLPDGFQLLSSGQTVFTANASGVVIDGEIIASGGSIGGWEISESYLKSSNDDGSYLDLSSATDQNSDYWIRAVNASGDLTFSIKKNGDLNVSSGTIGGCTIIDNVLSIKNANADGIVATNANITGTLNATHGKIAAWEIDGNNIVGQTGNGHPIQLSPVGVSGYYLVSGSPDDNPVYQQTFVSWEKILTAALRWDEE